MTRALWVAGVALSLGSAICELRAQPAQAIVDSAMQARSAFRAASQATTTRDALDHLQRAAYAWPSQPAYWIAVARLGARLSDTSAVQHALGALADLHAGVSLLADTAMQRLSHTPSIDRALQHVARTNATIAAGRVIATLRDSTIFAEGVDADSRTDALYVASVRHRTVYEVRADGVVRDLRLSRDARIGSVLGVRVALDGRTLYVTTAGLPAMERFVAADSSISAIVRVRIADGVIEARWEVPANGTRHVPGDLAITDDGTVYASDSFAPVLYRLRVGADSLESIRHPLFRSLQGIAPVAGRHRLIVADYSHGLLRVDLATNAVTRIVDVPGSTSLGIDGIIWHDRGIIAVQNGIAPARIARFTLDATQDHIVRVEDLDRQPDLADEPTIGTLWRGGYVYVANSQWEKYDDSVRRPGTALRPTVLLCIPLGSVASATPGQASRSRQVVRTSPAVERKGTRSTASAPPSGRTCKVSDAASP